MRTRAKILIFLFAFLMIFSSISFAAELNSKDLQWEPKWYRPKILPSVELARSVLANLMASQKFSTWLGYNPSKIDVDKYGLRIFGTYEKLSETVIINLADLKATYLYYLPNLDRVYKWCVVIVPHNLNANIQYLRALDLETSQNLIDVLDTMAIAAGSNLYSSSGIIFYTDDKEIEKLKKDIGWNEGYGAFVKLVEANSPADVSGFKPGDVIVELNGERVKDNSFTMDIQKVLEGKESVQFDVKVYRNKAFQNLSLTVPNFNYGKDKLLLSLNQQSSQIPANKVNLGIHVKPDTYTSGSNVNYVGLKVLKLDPNGLAEESGIKVGDIILEINDKPVRDTASMASIISNEIPVKFKVLRNGEILTLDAAQSF
ncbi:PDZ/DHR/GLGF domain protein [Thermodesulfobium narugense DSM 14796]|uniref:PDZ/DHR/GLGF domain protein n=1 Tax=Thermodesulfobium narugense DSM 14796 TaxID=747365 RepID=M1E7L7_9BACT|nr:PDZ domain-containing protein [Thermodesulfobium narugense]AEE14698.1 PDZ/DHR/GLGF domain protein [Thermodesulfobium narugense DSM 14796]